MQQPFAGGQQRGIGLATCLGGVALRRQALDQRPAQQLLAAMLAWLLRWHQCHLLQAAFPARSARRIALWLLAHSQPLSVPQRLRPTSFAGHSLLAAAQQRVFLAMHLWGANVAKMARSDQKHQELP